MSIRKRPSKQALSGYTYQVYFPYVDSMGVHRVYFKGGFKTKKDATTHEAMKRNELATYGDVLANRNITFNEVFEEYMDIEGKVKYARSTTQYYMYTYKQHVKHTIGLGKIVDFKYRDIQKYFNELDVGLSTGKNIKKIFNVTFNHAMKSGYVRENPMPLVKLHIKPKPTEDKEVYTLDKIELDALLEKIIIVDNHCPRKDYTQFNYYSYAVALFIGWYTGLRVSETFGLRKEDFDFENNTIKIQRRLEYNGLKKKDLYTTEDLKSKNAKATIPMVSKLREGMLKWFEKNPYEKVIVDINGDFVHPMAFNARISKLRKELDLDFHYHCLRHTFTTTLVENDVKPNIAMKLVRHGDIKTTLGVYTHVKEESKSEVLENVFGKEGL